MNEKPAKWFSKTCLTFLALAALFGPATDVASAAGVLPSIILTWNPSANADVTNYIVYYGVASGVYTNELAVGATNLAIVTGLVPGTTYFFAVTAVDNNDLESTYSNETNCMAPFSDTPPVIGAQPASQTVLTGGQASFSVTANGAPPLTYNWSFNGKLMPGATNATLTLTNVLPAEMGSYAVWVGNSYGSTLSSTAVLTLATLPGITVQPASQSVETGCSAVFNVVASGTAPLSYQWRFNGAALVTQTNASLDMNGVLLSQFGDYSVVVSNAFGTVASAVAELALASPPRVEPVFVQRFPQGGVRLNVSVLFSNATVASYNALTLIAVSSNSTAGGTVTLTNPWIYYTPPAGAAANDTFTYALSDGHCGTTVGVVTVVPSATNQQPSNFAIGKVGDGSLLLTFEGEPNGTYQLQSSGSLSSQIWLALCTQKTDEFGLFQFTDLPDTNVMARFYRAVWRPSIQPESPVVPGKVIATAPATAQ